MTEGYDLRYGPRGKGQTIAEGQTTALCDRSLPEAVLVYMGCMDAMMYPLRCLYDYSNNLGINIINIVITSTHHALRFFHWKCLCTATKLTQLGRKQPSSYT